MNPHDTTLYNMLILHPFASFEKLGRPVRAFPEQNLAFSQIFGIEFLDKLYLRLPAAAVFVFLCDAWIIKKDCHLKFIGEAFHDCAAARPAAAMEEQGGFLHGIAQPAAFDKRMLAFILALDVHNHNGLLYHIMETMKMSYR